jgi:hypothetical protein
MFAVALLIHVYLYGALPGYGNEYESPAAAILDGASLAWGRGVPDRLRRLLALLTDVDPGARPDIAAVLAALSDESLLDGAPRTRSRLRINMNGNQHSPAQR